MGRFASPDTIVPDPGNPQSFNRYSYALNNPIKYTDPSGHCVTNDQEITRGDAFDCTVDEMAQLSWETRHWWLEMLAAQTGADWFRNIHGIISYFASDPQFSALDGWASLSDAGVLVVIQDGWRLSQERSAINTSASAMQASSEWESFFRLLEGLGPSDPVVASQWGTAEQAGVDYGVELAEPLKGISDSATRAEIETFVTFGNLYRSLISNQADRILTSNLRIYGLRPQAAFDPRTNTSQIFVYLWSKYIVSPISSISSQ